MHLSSKVWTHTGDALQRKLGHSEHAFFRSSSSGLGDMFLHLAFAAPRDMMRRERVQIAWAIIRLTHPLLMSTVRVENSDLKDASLCFTPPRDAQDVLDNADHVLYYRTSSKEELISNYMNGPRTLSNDHLSYLVISHPLAHSPDPASYDLFMCAPHFTGDGTSLHQSTHDLLAILASPKSDPDLRQDLETQLSQSRTSWPSLLPPAFESRLPVSTSRLAGAADQINFLLKQQNEVGNHVFPRVQRAPRRTLLVEHAFSEQQTKAILAACKRNGVSVNNAIFALCSIAWAKTRPARDKDNTLPIMIYSAMNLRSFLTPLPTTPPTYWFLALTYFTITLPSFLPPSPSLLPPRFWHRARLAKAQTASHVKSPFLPARALLMASHRSGTLPPSATTPQLPPHARSAPVPSRALLGLSLIGNLDSTYVRGAYGREGVTLHSVTTASRQKAGGLLVLAHTFGGKLWLHLCWDECGFEEGVVESWWRGVVGGVGELMC